VPFSDGLDTKEPSPLPWTVPPATLYTALLAPAHTLGAACRTFACPSATRALQDAFEGLYCGAMFVSTPSGLVAYLASRGPERSSPRRIAPISPSAERSHLRVDNGPHLLSAPAVACGRVAPHFRGKACRHRLDCSSNDGFDDFPSVDDGTSADVVQEKAFETDRYHLRRKFRIS
jgi:hypothetical protein